MAFVGTSECRHEFLFMGSDKFILFQDGNAWCAAPPGFRNYTLDPSGWGDTPAKGRSGLIER